MMLYTPLLSQSYITACSIESSLQWNLICLSFCINKNNKIIAPSHAFVLHEDLRGRPLLLANQGRRKKHRGKKALKVRDSDFQLPHSSRQRIEMVRQLIWQRATASRRVSVSVESFPLSLFTDILCPSTAGTMPYAATRSAQAHPRNGGGFVALSALS